MNSKMDLTRGNIVWALMACYNQKHGLRLGKNSKTLSDIAAYYKVRKFLTPAQIDLAYELLPDEALESPHMGSLPPDARKSAPKDSPKAKAIVNEIVIEDNVLAIPKQWITPIRKQFYDAFRDTPTLSGKETVKVPLSWISLDNLEELKLPITDDIRAWRNSFLRGPLPQLDLSASLRTPLEHQPFAVQCAIAQGGKLLLADDLGLGKTTEAVLFLLVQPEALPAVIVCPASLKLNWKREIEAVFGKNKLRIDILDGLPMMNRPPQADILILNYDIIGHKALHGSSAKKPNLPFPTHTVQRKGKFVRVHTGWGRFLSQSKCYKTIIFDEGQYLKNSEAARTTACLGLAKTMRHVLWLSGTPLEQRPIELWTAINLLVPGMFSSKEEYGRAFCGGHRDRFGRWDFSGCAYAPALNDWLSRTIMVRRRKNLLKELPESVRHIIPLQGSTAGMSEYRKAERDFIAWYKKNKGKEAAERAMRAEHLARLLALRQLAWKAKQSDTLEWIQNFLESDEKLVIFYSFTEVGNEVAKTLKEWKTPFVRLDGSTPQKERQDMVDSFQNNSGTRVFIGQVVAAGTGLTLTAASNTVFLNQEWNPARMVQAEGRCHRHGQTKSVSHWWLGLDNSVEMDVIDVLQTKQDVVAQVLDGLPADDTPVLRAATQKLLDRASHE